MRYGASTVMAEVCGFTLRRMADGSSVAFSPSRPRLRDGLGGHQLSLAAVRALTERWRAVLRAGRIQPSKSVGRSGTIGALARCRKTSLGSARQVLQAATRTRSGRPQAVDPCAEQVHGLDGR